MMRRIALAVVALLICPVGLPATQAHVPAPDPLAALEAAPTGAPASWAPQDPADSLYRAAREAMNRGEYDRAAILFQQVWKKHPRSAYAPDALYWAAFSRYRLGDTSELERALELLDVQRQRYATAATLQSGDARSLETRIAGLLARRGNADAAARVVATANAVAGLGAELGAELGMRMEAVARDMALRGEVLGEQLARVAERGAAVAMAVGAGSAGSVPEECRDRVDTQLAALNALTHMSPERAFPVLERVMDRRDDCAAPLRRRAVFLIADKRSPEAVDLLLKAARSDPDLDVRRQAVFWLSEVDDPRAVKALESYIMQSDDDKIRERAIFALSRHGSPQTRQILRRVARDGAMPVGLRSKAIFWLGTDGRPDDLDFLKSVFGKLGDPKLDERILFTVGQVERGTDTRWLLSVASNDAVAPDLRRAAVFWAAESGASAADLGALYDRLDDRKLKERIIFGLSESRQPAAIDKLIQIVRTEEDGALRQKAIFWLGNSNDPRAADVLLEVLADPSGGR